MGHFKGSYPKDMGMMPMPVLLQSGRWADDMAGEVGHIRMTENGPVGYGKPAAVAHHFAQSATGPP